MTVPEPMVTIISAAALYAILNLGVFLLYGFDKWSAGRSGLRVPERLLLFSSAAGPAGAYCSMKLFRHKTRKARFLLVPLFLIVHVAIIVVLVTGNFPFP